MGVSDKIVKADGNRSEGFVGEANWLDNPRFTSNRINSESKAKSWCSDNIDLSFCDKPWILCFLQDEGQQQLKCLTTVKGKKKSYLG